MGAKKKDQSVEIAATKTELKKPAVHDTLIGTLSEDIFIEEENIKSPQEIEAELYRDLKRYEKDGEILWGRIYGVESIENHVAICVLWNNIKVTIPDEMYFEDTFDFGKNYEKMTETEKFDKRLKTARYHIGAKICFKVGTVIREVIKTGEFEGEYSITVIGSRKAAMKTLRDIYFWHKNRKRADGKAPRSVKEGDLIYANVLGVKEDTVLIECAGVETRLGSYNLLSNEVVENCCDHVSVGDKIKVRVKKVYLNDDNSVHLNVTGRIGEVSKLIGTIKVGATYLGRVEKYNAEKNVYTVILSIGVIASIPESNVLGRVVLTRGDSVAVFVSNIYDSFVSGSAIKQ